MKELREIARELACLEEDLRKLGTRLGRLGGELDRLREAETGGPVDFEAVRFCAECFPDWRHPLESAGVTLGKDRWRYPTAILSLARWNDTNMNLLVLCQWLLNECGSSKSLEDCLTAGYRAGPEQFQWLKQNLDGNLRTMFLLDLLTAASLSGPPCGEALEYISELAALLNCGERELSVLTLAAEASLRQSAGWMERADAEWLYRLPEPCRFYLPEQVWKQVQSKMRLIVMQESGDLKQISWKKEQGEYVCRGDVLAKVKSHVLSSRSNRITSPGSGWFYHFSLKKVSYAVLSGPSDSKESLKAWVRDMQQTPEEGNART